MGRKKDVDLAPDLAPLTFDEAARVLGITKFDFMEWLARIVNPSDDLLYKWTRRARPLPEKLIRRYLTWKIASKTDSPESTSVVTSEAEGRRSLRSPDKRRRA